MNVAVSVFICFLTALGNVNAALPPDLFCFFQFRWEDCGMPPVPVIYYYRPGSRCEVGFWRGCQPNPNMFANAYDCMQTCIFSVRAKLYDFHNFQENLIDEAEKAEIADIATSLTEGINIALDATTSDSTIVNSDDVVNKNDGEKDRRRNIINETKTIYSSKTAHDKTSCKFNDPAWCNPYLN